MGCITLLFVTTYGLVVAESVVTDTPHFHVPRVAPVGRHGVGEAPLGVGAPPVHH